MLDQFFQITIPLLECLICKGYITDQKEHQRLVVLVMSLSSSDIQGSFEVCYSRIRKEFLNLLLWVSTMSPLTYLLVHSSFLRLPPPLLLSIHFFFFFIPFWVAFDLFFFFWWLSKAPKQT